MSETIGQAPEEVLAAAGVNGEEESPAGNQQLHAEMEALEARTTVIGIEPNQEERETAIQLWDKN